jgi:glutamate 5-kinase
MSEDRKAIVANVKKLLIKIGSGVLTGKEGLELNLIDQLVREMADLKNRGMHIVLVTSGAVASGRHRMGLMRKLKNMPEKQAAAAIGQGRLMRVYSNAFGKHGINVAQMLLTMSDIADRQRFINVRNTLSQLLDWGVIPIINENDTVSVDEIKFGDNDHLAAVMATIVNADLLINLTTTEGLYDRDPRTNKKARIIRVVRDITPEIEAAATADSGPVGTGGMKSKIMAAQKVTACGIPCIVAPGRKKGVFAEIFSGMDTGTLFLPKAECLSSKESWIAFSLRARGKLIIDEGAKEAILHQGKSLLPSGIVGVEGDFTIGDPVLCLDSEGNQIAKGLVNYSADEIKKIQGLKTSKIEQVLGHKNYDEVIHRDNMAVLK